MKDSDNPGGMLSPDSHPSPVSSLEPKEDGSERPADTKRKEGPDYESVDSQIFDFVMEGGWPVTDGGYAGSDAYDGSGTLADVDHESPVGGPLESFERG